MAKTVDVDIASGDWVLVAENPPPIRIRCSGSGYVVWRVFVTDTGLPPEEGSRGELLIGQQVWESGGLTGRVYVKAPVGIHLAVVAHA